MFYLQVFLVGVRRLELPTSTSRTWRASQLCYTPIFALQRYNFYCKKTNAILHLARNFFLFYFAGWAG